MKRELLEDVSGHCWTGKQEESTNLLNFKMSFEEVRGQSLQKLLTI